MPEWLQIILGFAAVIGMVLGFFWLLASIGEDARKEESVEREKKYGSSDSWHVKHFNSAGEFAKWLNKEDSPVGRNGFGGLNFVIIPTKDGFDVVFDD